MPRRDRRARARPQNRPARAEILELLIGPNGASVFDSESRSQEVADLVRGKISNEFEQQWFAFAAERKPFAQIAEQYARDVVQNVIAACKFVRLACKRHLDDLARAAAGGWLYEFSVIKAERACRFIELLPHTKGRWALRGERMVLQPWQIFIICCIFGWVKVLSQTRRFSRADITVPRKNGKSQLAAGIGLYLFCADGEFGAEVYSGATSEKQAMEVFRPAYKMLEGTPELAIVLGIRLPTTKKIEVSADGSRFEPVVRNPGDGSSPHGAIVDEYHEHDNDTLYDTFKTGMGARDQALALVITTAGDNLAGPCKLLQDDDQKVLEGTMPGDDVFAIIYTIDPEDDWTSEVALVKANPNIGVSVSREFLLAEQRAAILRPRKQGVFKTKHLCVWVGALMAYFDSQQWKRLGDPSLKADAFAGTSCSMAVDLSSKKDFTARVLLFKKVRDAKEHYFAFVRFYLPQAQVEAAENQHYQGWKEEGYLTMTDGNVMDFRQVTRETADEIKRFKPRELGFDPWNAEQLVQEIEAMPGVGVQPVKIEQRTAKLSAPTKELDALIADGRIHHDGNPVMAWMIGNVTALEDANENVFPQKQPGREENKIDGAIALIMALSRAMAPAARQSVYKTRGLRTL